MNGKQLATLTAKLLAHDTNLAANRVEQRKYLGIAKSKYLRIALIVLQIINLEHLKCTQSSAL
ncbi:MAG: hypothetical protein ABJP82_04640 [Hyphomicrobiales bacterium]